jgi:hypothetical protein
MFDPPSNTFLYESKRFVADPAIIANASGRHFMKTTALPDSDGRRA